MTQTPTDPRTRPRPVSGAVGTTGLPKSATRAKPPRPEKPKRPLWVRWTALILFVAVMGTIFVSMGDWQLRRLAQRKASNHVILTNEARPVAAFGSIFTEPIGKALEWRRVQVSGTYDGAHQYVVRYRDNGDATGYEVVTPLHTTSGQTVLIDRGFVPVDKGTQIPSTAAAPPTGRISLVGRVRRSEPGRLNAITPVDGQMRLINAYAVATTLPYPVVDGYIDVLQQDPARAAELQTKVLPEISDGPHFWYAVQWFMFTGIGLAGIVVFIRGDLRERKAAKAGTAQTAGQTTARGRVGRRPVPLRRGDADRAAAVGPAGS